MQTFRAAAGSGWRGLRGRELVPVFVAAAMLLACDHCDDDIEAAGGFLGTPANLACETNDDCVVVNTGCHTYERGTCAQAQLNRAAAKSREWSELQSDLNDCGDDICAQCAVLLVAGCVEGFCGGPP
jgi:hypothetical protein